jgi:hypothetical protein
VLALGLLLLAAALKRRAWPAALTFAALGWLWVGLVFHGRYHAGLNWAADAIAVAWVVQALLLLWAATWPGGWSADGSRRRLGLGLLAVAVLLAPAAALTGRPAELFALTPDATALGTLGLLLCGAPASPGLARALWPLPAAALLLGAATAVVLAG